MRLLVAVLALWLAACGGSPEPPRRPAFGWWGGAIGLNDYLAEAPGATLAQIAPESIERVAPMADRARALGMRPILILWPLIRHETGLKWDWRDTLDAAVAACGDCDYYVADEPYHQAVPWLPADLDAVVARLPPGRMVLLSLSVPELQREVYVPQGVTVGANLYSSAGETPASARRYLDTLATYGRPLYLTLDGIVQGRRCEDVTPEQIAAAIELNEAMHAWADRRRVPIYIAFNWQTSSEPGNLFCGSRDLPALRDYLLGRFGAS